jgi:hypothetical protein
MWPGQGMSLKVKEVLYEAKSQYQVRPRPGPASCRLAGSHWCSCAQHSPVQQPLQPPPQLQSRGRRQPCARAAA